jgi:hypothetical protein
MVMRRLFQRFFSVKVPETTLDWNHVASTLPSVFAIRVGRMESGQRQEWQQISFHIFQLVALP